MPSDIEPEAPCGKLPRMESAVGSQFRDLSHADEGSSGVDNIRTNRSWVLCRGWSTPAGKQQDGDPERQDSSYGRYPEAHHTGSIPFVSCPYSLL